MFEPKTYTEKVAGLTTVMFKQLVGSLPEAVQQDFLPFYRQAMAAEQLMKVGHANDVLGPVMIEDSRRAQLAWVTALLSLNLGRVFFNNRLTGAKFDGALGTKSYGMKFKPWIASLPDMDDSFGVDMASGFYRDSSRDHPYFVAVVNNQIITYIASGPQVFAQQLYLEHLPPQYNWLGAREEIFPYRGDVTRVQVAVEFARAVIAEGVTTLVIPQESHEEIMAALTAGGFNTTLEIVIDDAERPIEQLSPPEAQAISIQDQEEEQAEAAQEHSETAHPLWAGKQLRFSCSHEGQDFTVTRDADQKITAGPIGAEKAQILATVPFVDRTQDYEIEVSAAESPTGSAGFYPVGVIALVEDELDDSAEQIDETAEEAPRREEVDYVEADTADASSEEPQA